MQAALLIEETAWYAGRHRLALCMALSAFVVFFLIVTLDWPARFELPRLVPLELEITIRPPSDAAEFEARALPPPLSEPDAPAETAGPATSAIAQPAAPPRAAEPAEQVGGAERAVGATPGTEAPAARVDWYAELERAAAEVSARAAAEPKSMHPEFDELRRIAAQRYGAPDTAARPALAWDWKVEKDSSGRTLLKRGNSYIILDDPRLFNQYAFETFEKHMVFFAVPLGKAPPKNLPWVETIRARYEYLREPDELPPLKSVPAEAGLPAR